MTDKIDPWLIGGEPVCSGRSCVSYYPPDIADGHGGCVMQHGSPHFGASEGFACIPGIRRQRDEARERAERLDVQLQDTQSDYGALEAERDELRAEVARLREDVIRWANEFEARHGVYPEITAAADDLRAALAGEVVE